MSLKEILQYLEDRGLSVAIFLIEKGSIPIKSTKQDKKSIEERFMLKYKLNENDVKTLTLCAQGLTDERIAERLGTITAEGVRKRMKKLRKNLNASNKTELVAKAIEEGLI